ncbi:hypothetical protein [Marihabitans asiaticum]|uniref:Protein ImuA n=1 Tax=Marihabitans asiaticum TaxID=415218 RepID=A0A560W834_9MICO|nr:hypothetical protein [Marihabitans asiaticum]TWD13768.1 hypothetical protein FB557_2401 [Marihabitans asiaticum]
MATVDLATLKERVRVMERGTQTRTRLTRSDAVDLLVPGGLRAGGTYAVHGSQTLVAALLAGGSAAGRWCGVVGMPDLGLEGAAGLGLDLTRTLSVPAPGPDWAEATAILVEALPLVAVRPPGAVSRHDAARLSARLRARSSALVLHSPDPASDLRWPSLEASLQVHAQAWSGIGDGRGRLLARALDVTVAPRRGRSRTVRLAQDATGRVTPFATVADALTPLADLLDARDLPATLAAS